MSAHVGFGSLRRRSVAAGRVPVVPQTGRDRRGKGGRGWVTQHTCRGQRRGRPSPSGASLPPWRPLPARARSGSAGGPAGRSVRKRERPQPAPPSLGTAMEKNGVWIGRKGPHHDAPLLHGLPVPQQHQPFHRRLFLGLRGCSGGDNRKADSRTPSTGSRPAATPRDSLRYPEHAGRVSGRPGPSACKYINGELSFST